jgi:hypothetical protein
MAHDPQNTLPELLEPLFDYIIDLLPPPLDTVVVRGVIPLFGRASALCQSLYALGLYLFSTDPSTWDAQKILPPLITLLAAYLGLLSFYRTTSWMVRTSIWFAKWGAVLGAFGGGLGYLAGQQGNGGGINLRGGFAGVAHSVGDILWEALNSPAAGQGTGASSSTTKRPKSTRKRPKKKPAEGAKPKPWDSFDKHDQYHVTLNDDTNPEVDEELSPGFVDGQKIMTQIVGFAGRMGWLDSMKEAVDAAVKEVAAKAAEGLSAAENTADNKAGDSSGKTAKSQGRSR